MSSIPPKRLASKTEVQVFFDISSAVLERWIRDGCPVERTGSPGMPWVFDLLKVAEWHFTNEVMRIISDNNGQPIVENDPDKMSPRNRKDWYDGENKKRDLMIRDGLLIPVQNHEREMSLVIKQFINFLDTFGDVLERDAGIGPEVLDKVQGSVDSQREILFHSLTKFESAERE
jgi:hypothetical protein